jgi:serine/threonine protein kinase
MAPELLSKDVCGKEADIWAFGCILFEMLFKKSPFFDNSEGMIWKKILND